MKKIAVIGCGGSGKSTLSRELGQQILNHIQAQPPPLKPATAIQSQNTLGSAGQL
jgi:adenylate kinase family enzyme